MGLFQTSLRAKRSNLNQMGLPRRQRLLAMTVLLRLNHHLQYLLLPTAWPCRYQIMSKTLLPKLLKNKNLLKKIFFLVVIIIGLLLVSSKNDNQKTIEQHYIYPTP